MLRRWAQDVAIFPIFRKASGERNVVANDDIGVANRLGNPVVGGIGIAQRI